MKPKQKSGLNQYLDLEAEWGHEHHPGYAKSEHEGRLLLGDPVAQAYEWINRYIQNLSQSGGSRGLICTWCDESFDSKEEVVGTCKGDYDGTNKGERHQVYEDEGIIKIELTFDELVETALLNVDPNRTGDRERYIYTGNNEVDLDDTFWDKLSVLKGLEIPSDVRHSFFSCAC